MFDQTLILCSQNTITVYMDSSEQHKNTSTNRGSPLLEYPYLEAMSSQWTSSQLQSQLEYHEQTHQD